MKNQSLEKEDYYQIASDWAYDLYQSQTIWLRRALATLVFLGFMLIMSLGVNLVLFPLKEKVPYLYAFDHDKKTALTNFPTSIKNASVNANGGKVVFERDYELWLYDAASKQAEKLNFSIISQLLYFDFAKYSKITISLFWLNRLE